MFVFVMYVLSHDSLLRIDTELIFQFDFAENKVKYWNINWFLSESNKISWRDNGQVVRFSTAGDWMESNKYTPPPPRDSNRATEQSNDVTQFIYLLKSGYNPQNTYLQNEDINVSKYLRLEEAFFQKQHPV